MTDADPLHYSQLLLTPPQMAAADRASISAGVSGIALMEAAGKAVADAVQRRWPRQNVLVLCGPGNNGGDGFVAARHLQAAGWPVRLSQLLPTQALTGDAAHHASLWTDGTEPFSIALLDQTTLVVDALFGAGLTRPLEGAALAMVQALAARRALVCAVDVPSGLDGATGAILGDVQGAAAPAALTVTFFRKKPGHLLYPGRALCGELVVADIGTPKVVFEAPGTDGAVSWQTWENDPALWRARFPWPQADGHKYQRGHAVVLGGSSITGASRLTARAAARMGAGLVTLAVPEAVWPVYAAAMTGVMVHALPAQSPQQGFAELLADPRRNAVAIGPGAGVDEPTHAAVLAALHRGCAVVLDADALTSFATDPAQLFSAIKAAGGRNGKAAHCVLTPHDGEFARLFDTAGDKLTRARRAAALSGAVVLLKGSDTVIAEPGGRAVINSNAPPDLATGGSGDVLTGFIAGLLAQGLNAFDAACAASWLHGAAATAFGPGLVAEDLSESLPGVLRALKASPGGDCFGAAATSSG